jgi:serine/threonine-protein kinase
VIGPRPGAGSIWSYPTSNNPNGVGGGLKDRWFEVERLLDQLLDSDPGERAHMLAGIRSQDPALGSEVERLLQAITSAKDFLQDSAPTYAAPLLDKLLNETGLLPGTRLSTYEILRELGRGGTATVYLARDGKHGRQVAIKVPHAELASLLGPERFLREIQIAAQLQHPNILPLHDSGEVDGVLYYVMPHVEGESLRQRLERESRLLIEDALRIVSEVADALAYAHARGIVHRDIKPENILLSGGHALVADFGIARAITMAGGERLHETGPLGTAAYMSPEQAAADPQLDQRSDIYSLGCVLYEMLAGKPPYTGSTAAAIMERRLAGIPSLRRPRHEVPVHVEQGIHRALARAPADRFATAQQFASALREETRPDRNSRVFGIGRSTSARGLVVLSGAVALVGLALAGASTTFPNRSPEMKSVAILPCEGPVADSTAGYVAERWSEELIEKLSKLRDLRVKSWLSMRRFRHTSKNSREIGKELGAGTLVRCSVAETSDSLRLRLQVIAASRDEVLSSQQYARALSAGSINDVQTQAVQAIAGRVGATPSPRERTQLEQPQTQNLAALQAYRQGREFLGSLDVTRSIPQFEQAIARDSLFASAYVGLSDAIVIHGQQEGRPTREYIPRSVQLVLKALELDPTLAEAHTLLGDYLLVFNHDWSSAETEYRRAVQLDPNSVIAHLWYGFGLVVVGHAERGVAELERAVALDPAFPLAHIQLASALRVAGQYQRAIQEIHSALQISPDNPVAYLHLGMILLQQGLADSAVAAFEKGVQLGAGWADARSRLANAYGVSGQRAKATKILHEILRAPSVDALHIARIQAGLGDNAETMRWLERAYLEKSYEILTALGGQDPAFHPLRADPGYQALRTRIGMDKW